LRYVCHLIAGVIPHIHKSLIGKKGTPQAPWVGSLAVGCSFHRLSAVGVFVWVSVCVWRLCVFVCLLLD